MELKFIVEESLKEVIPQPLPASQKHPEWFKALKGSQPGMPGQWPMGTAKRCVPFIDALSAGYILPLPQATRVEVSGDNVSFSWRENNQPSVGFHSLDQIAGSGVSNIFKFISPWGVQLPEGYSALYVHPLNHFDLPFLSLSGIVDDTFSSPVQIPFTWIAGDGEYYLDAGLPIAQIIPFKREEFSHSIETAPISQILKDGMKAVSRLDGYRTHFHKKKVYS